MGWTFVLSSLSIRLGVESAGKQHNFRHFRQTVSNESDEYRRPRHVLEETTTGQQQ